MPERKGHFPPQNNFLDTIASRFDGTHSNFVLGSAQVPGIFPIVYCSDGFCELTGFPRGQVMRKCSSCPFLYGSLTNAEEKVEILNALKNHEEFDTEVVLYKKNNEPFLCLLDIVPIKNEKSQVVMFLVSHKNLPVKNGSEDNVSVNSDNSHASFSLTGSCNSVISSKSDAASFKKLGHRRRSRGVLYNLSQNFEIKPKPGFFKSFSQRLLGRRKNASLEYKVSNNKPSRFTILHFGTAKTAWDWFVMFITVYITAMIPYYAAVQSVPSEYLNGTKTYFIGNDSPTDTFSLVVDFLIEFVFISDIILTFRTTYVNKSGWVVVNSKDIATNYFRTWLFFDIIAALPVDTISHIFQVDLSVQPMPMLKLVRLFRLIRLFHKAERWFQYSAVVLIMLMLAFGLVAHWLACVWLHIGWKEFQLQPFRSNGGVGWLHELSETLQKPFYSNGTGGPDVTSSYITSLYFTLSSLTSVGFGNVSANTNNEKIFSICIMIIGALMHAVVFGNVTAIIQRMYAKRSQYDIKMRDLKDFIKIHRLPKSTKERMINHFQYTWDTNSGVNAKKVLKDFPADIQADVAMHIYKDVLNIPIFRKGPEGMRRYLSLHIEQRKISPGEVMIYDGDPLSSVNYVCKGSLEVLKNDLVISILSKGDLFGADMNEAPYNAMTSHADVKALSYCELECISAKGLKGVIEYFPEFAPSVMQHMRSDFSCNLSQPCGSTAEQVGETSNLNCKNDATCYSSGGSSTESYCDSREHKIKEKPNEASYFARDNRSDISQDEISLLSVKARNKIFSTSYEETVLHENINSSSVTLENTASAEKQGVNVSVESGPKEKEFETLDVPFVNFITSPRKETAYSSSSSLDNRNLCPGKTRLKFDEEHTTENNQDPIKKTYNSSRLTTFFNSFNDFFTRKSNSEMDISRFAQESNGRGNISRPSCFKKSLLSLDSRNPSSQRSDWFNASGEKRVTFFDQLQNDTTFRSKTTEFKSLASKSNSSKSTDDFDVESAKIENLNLSVTSKLQIKQEKQPCFLSTGASQRCGRSDSIDSSSETECDRTGGHEQEQDEELFRLVNESSSHEEKLGKSCHHDLSGQNQSGCVGKSVNTKANRNTRRKRRLRRRSSVTQSDFRAATKRQCADQDALKRATETEDGGVTVYLSGSDDPTRTSNHGRSTSSERVNQEQICGKDSIIGEVTRRLRFLSSQMISMKTEMENLTMLLNGNTSATNLRKELDVEQDSLSRTALSRNGTLLKRENEARHETYPLSPDYKKEFTPVSLPHARALFSTDKVHNFDHQALSKQAAHTKSLPDKLVAAPVCTLTAPNGETNEILILPNHRSATTFDKDICGLAKRGVNHPPSLYLSPSGPKVNNNHKNGSVTDLSSSCSSDCVVYPLDFDQNCSKYFTWNYLELRGNGFQLF
ncbi:uncharacterized protein LOC143469711 isoform X1 [Clavelina lepadiformis]|uniref:uncharacterized protein LOC143469711 isoform X1 n=1 Tax=Clavelina lepadiformis TaxID=159417 RepID=UPI0040427C8C